MEKLQALLSAYIKNNWSVTKGETIYIIEDDLLQIRVRDLEPICRTVENLIDSCDASEDKYQTIWAAIAKFDVYATDGYVR